MHHPVEDYYARLEEPHQSALLFIREFILDFSSDFTEHFKWSAPFFYYQGKMCCYFWWDKKLEQPYLSFGEGKYIHHPALKSYGRKRFKLYYINSSEDIDTETLHFLLTESVKSMIKRGA